MDEVTLRHLASGGDLRHVTENLLAAGWSNQSVPGYPHVLPESPDGQLHLALEPTAPEPRESWCRIHPAERGEVVRPVRRPRPDRAGPAHRRKRR
ncbi:hypothetical protein ABZ848_27855 [Streptomyces sp. NPDC047081]|uniref:hypothetical protein n=1 Tax=Streptomyces sp. NPDC047081 TaxID=3154706 RepID=UPI0033F87697